MLELEDDSVETRTSGSWLDLLREEIDSYYEEMKTFENRFSDDVFMKLSAWTARMSEVRGQLTRSSRPAANRVRIDEVDPFIAECERQFRYHSRKQSVNEMDFRLAGRTT